MGYYALLWILGPSADFLNVAHYLPAATLPTDFQLEFDTHPFEGRPVLPTNETLAATNEETDVSGATEQASYAEPNERDRAAYDSSVTSDQSPLPFEETAAAPITAEADIQVAKIAGAPSFNADELAVALTAAKEAQPSLVKGELEDGPEVQRAKGFGYSILCDLAQKLAFVDSETRADYAKALAADAERLFRQTLIDAHTQSDVAFILPKWIRSPSRKHGGVFFAGRPLQNAEHGSVVECQMDAGTGEPITILLPTGTADQLTNSSKPVGIVGWIVDAPAKKISGYTGDSPRAIWARCVLPLD
jgi:hypothetical protein